MSDKGNNFKTMDFEAELGELDNIFDFIESCIMNCNLSDYLSQELINEVWTPVSEACSNVIKHSYAKKKGKLTINCSISARNNFVITILDHGRSFDPKAIQIPDINAPTNQRKGNGLGYFLMKHFIDVKYYPKESNFNRCNRLTMFRPLS